MSPDLPEDDVIDRWVRRDQFAAAALQGLLASYAFEAAALPKPGTLAVQAWLFADAMLAAEKEAPK